MICSVGRSLIKGKFFFVADASFTFAAHAAPADSPIVAVEILDEC